MYNSQFTIHNNRANLAKIYQISTFFCKYTNFNVIL